MKRSDEKLILINEVKPLFVLARRPSVPNGDIHIVRRPPQVKPLSNFIVRIRK
jgi:hypothetical protein